MAASGRATCHADVSMTSARGQPFADISMAIADVSVESVNVDQVNRSVAPPISLMPEADVWVLRVSRVKRKKKKRRLGWVLGSKKMGRLGSAHTARLSLGDRLKGLGSV